jgi:hypothetical protein
MGEVEFQAAGGFLTALGFDSTAFFSGFAFSFAANSCFTFAEMVSTSTL